MYIDFLIVGQGVAGSVLAWTLDQRGSSVVVADDPVLPSASKAAAGIVNPLTGRKLVRTWKADELFPFLHRFYQQIEGQLNVQFFQPKCIYRPFRTPDEKTLYTDLTNAGETGSYVNIEPDDGHYSPFIHNPLGGLEVTQAGWLDLNEFLRVVKGYFIQKNGYVETRVPETELDIRDDGVHWQGVTFGKVIFCDGALGNENSLFAGLPYNPVKGQLLTILAEGYTLSNIVNQGLFLLPVRPGLLKVGATYTWHDLDWQTTDDGRAFLENKLKPLLKLPYQVVGQQAGIRPSTKDRRPFVGLHPTHPRIGIFGGMGTKGVSLTPYLAEEFARFLLDDEELGPEVNISRCASL